MYSSSADSGYSCTTCNPLNVEIDSIFVLLYVPAIDKFFGLYETDPMGFDLEAEPMKLDDG
jgi:hypothetical protein